MVSILNATQLSTSVADGVAVGDGVGDAPGCGTAVAAGAGVAVDVAVGAGVEVETVPVHVGRPRREMSLVGTLSRLAGTQPVKLLPLSERFRRLLREFRVSGI